MYANALIVSMAGKSRVCLEAEAEMKPSLIEVAKKSKGVRSVEPTGGKLIVTLEEAMFKNSSRFSSFVNALALELNSRQPQVVFKIRPVKSAHKFLEVSRVLG